MSRDSDPATGVPLNVVRVWLALPVRRGLGDGAFWTGPSWPAATDRDLAADDDFYGEWTIEQALKHTRTYPDDDRQIIRVEGDCIRQPGDRVAGVN